MGPGTSLARVFLQILAALSVWVSLWSLRVSGVCATMFGARGFGIPDSVCFVSFACSLLAILASLALAGCAPLSLGVLLFLLLVLVDSVFGFLFLAFCSPSEFCTPSEFDGFLLCWGMIPGVLLRVVRWWTLGAARMVAGVVGVVNVGVVMVCCLSKFVVVVLNISANLFNACICLPPCVFGS